MPRCCIIRYQYYIPVQRQYEISGYCYWAYYMIQVYPWVVWNSYDWLNRLRYILDFSQWSRKTVHHGCPFFKWCVSQGKQQGYSLLNQSTLEPPPPQNKKSLAWHNRTHKRDNRQAAHAHTRDTRHAAVFVKQIKLIPGIDLQKQENKMHRKTEWIHSRPYLIKIYLVLVGGRNWLDCRMGGANRLGVGMNGTEMPWG